MTRARPWPNVAKEARDRAAEEAILGIRALRPMVRGERLEPVESMRRLAIALSTLQSIERLLESVGAPTRPM